MSVSYFIIDLTAFFIFKLMQNRVESKSRLQQYASTRDYDSTNPQTKKTLKEGTKSNKKVKPSKQPTHSQSKSKITSKPIRNNENVNSANMPNSDHHRHNHNKIDSEHPKKDVKIQERLKRVSSERLIKQKSAGKIAMKTERRQVSPSPISIRQYHHEQKNKTTRNGTNRSEKDKKVGGKHKEVQIGLKRNSSKACLVGKGDILEKSNRNRNSIKTQMSSKTQSVIKEDDRKKAGHKKPKKMVKKQQKTAVMKPYLIPKGEKSKIQQMVKRSILYSEVSFQQYNPDHPCESAFVSNDKYFLPYPQLKAVKTEGCQAENRSLMSYSRLEIAQNRAAIKIQKAFRGYITRKYIQEAKYIISKVKCIQAWWRKVLSAKSERLNLKQVSASNSLITLKDFNDTIKTDRQKTFSQSKQNCLSNNKANFKELIKNILEQNEESDHQNDDKDMSSMERDKSLSKQVYIELKLQNEINSQRKFNILSPKNMMSPSSVRTPTNSLFSFKDNMVSSAEKQKIKDILSSPRMKSPQQLKTTPKSSCRQQALFKKPEVQQKLTPFETHITALQQFCMNMVTYFRERPAQMTIFVDRLLRLCEFRTLLVLKNWSQHTLCYDQMVEIDDSPSADFEFLQIFQKPAILDKELRENILSFPQIEIDLEGKSYDLKSSVNEPIHRIYLDFMFDAIEEAFYEQYKGSVLIYGESLSKRYYSRQEAVLQHYFSDALGHLFRWGSIKCGTFQQLSISEQQIIKQQRFRELQRQMDHWDMGLGSSFAIKVEASEWIVLALICEMAEQFGHF